MKPLEAFHYCAGLFVGWHVWHEEPDSKWHEALFDSVAIWLIIVGMMLAFRGIDALRDARKGKR